MASIATALAQAFTPQSKPVIVYETTAYTAVRPISFKMRDNKLDKSCISVSFERRKKTTGSNSLGSLASLAPKSTKRDWDHTIYADPKTELSLKMKMNFERLVLGLELVILKHPSFTTQQMLNFVRDGRLLSDEELQQAGCTVVRRPLGDRNPGQGKAELPPFSRKAVGPEGHEAVLVAARDTVGYVHFYFALYFQDIADYSSDQLLDGQHESGASSAREKDTLRSAAGPSDAASTASVGTLATPVNSGPAASGADENPEAASREPAWAPYVPWVILLQCALLILLLWLYTSQKFEIALLKYTAAGIAGAGGAGAGPPPAPPSVPGHAEL